jgi:hypothetical protein
VQVRRPVESVGKGGCRSLLSLSGFHDRPGLSKIQTRMMTRNLLVNLIWRSSAQSISSME